MYSSVIIKIENVSLTIAIMWKHFFFFFLLFFLGFFVRVLFVFADFGGICVRCICKNVKFTWICSAHTNTYAGSNHFRLSCAYSFDNLVVSFACVHMPLPSVVFHGIILARLAHTRKLTHTHPSSLFFLSRFLYLSFSLLAPLDATEFKLFLQRMYTRIHNWHCCLLTLILSLLQNARHNTRHTHTCIFPFSLPHCHL